MKRHFSLAGLNWELVGTKPYYWKLDRQMEALLKYKKGDIRQNEVGQAGS